MYELRTNPFFFWLMQDIFVKYLYVKTSYIYCKLHFMQNIFALNIYLKTLFSRAQKDKDLVQKDIGSEQHTR